MHIPEWGIPRHFHQGPPGVAIAGALLRLAVLGYAIGITSAILGKLGSGLGTYFFLELGYTHPQVAPVERAVAFVLLGLAAAALIRPHWTLLAPIALAVFLESLALCFNGGFPFAEWTAFAHALRYGAPAALLLLCFAPLGRWIGPGNHVAVTGWVLRAAIATVFAMHGVEALLEHPRFIDYILGTVHNFTGHFPAESTAVAIMYVIGVVDILVAVLVLVRPHPSVLYWLALWGLITALARVTTFGLGHHHEVFVRSAHILAPLAVLFLLRAQAHYRTATAGPPEQSNG